MHFRIDPGIPQDAREFLRILSAAARAVAPGFYEPAVLEAWAATATSERRAKMEKHIAEGSELFFAARQDDQIIGFGAIMISTGHVSLLYVDPSIGRRGVGSALMDKLVETAHQRGLRELTLASSLNAEAFYRHHGFIVTGQETFRPPPDVEGIRVLMRRTL